MPNEQELKAEIGHVLFIDIVGYSKLLINQESELLQELKEIDPKWDSVRSNPRFAAVLKRIGLGSADERTP